MHLSNTYLDIGTKHGTYKGFQKVMQQFFLIHNLFY
jgi:hypothetical protein